MQVDHIDNNKSNNTLANLRWVTPSENVQHSFDTNANRKSCGAAKSRPIRCIETQTEYPSLTIAAKELRLHLGSIWSVLNGRLKTTGNLTFEYVEDPNLENECWENHPTLGLPVSTQGRVINQSRKTRGHHRKDGYMEVRYKGKNYLVHRLVAETWLHNPEKKPQVDHINNVRHKNTLTNLRWVTRSENIQHSWDTNANRKSNAAALSRPIRCIETQIEYPSITIAAKELRLNQGSICSVLNKKRKRTGDLTFEYVEEPDLENECWEHHLKHGMPVSTQGRVIIQSRKTPGYRRKDGYMVVQYKGKIHLVHRLVAETFLKGPGS
jgi:ribulose bisphosphate carboxylase small subunit